MLKIIGLLMIGGAFGIFALCSLAVIYARRAIRDIDPWEG